MELKTREWIKGFYKDMTCKREVWQDRIVYQEGKAYEKINVSDLKQFPLECFKDYTPATSVYHRVHIVEEEGRRKVKIGKRITLEELVRQAVKYSPIYKEEIATGQKMEECSALMEKRQNEIVSLTGAYSGGITTGGHALSVATARSSVIIASGDYAIAGATGENTVAIAKNNCTVSCVTGTGSEAIAESAGSIALAWGYSTKAKGVKGAYLLLTDWSEWEEDKDSERRKQHLKEVKMVYVDGKEIKENVWYALYNGIVMNVV